MENESCPCPFLVVERHMDHMALNETPHELATMHPAKLFPFVLNFSPLLNKHATFKGEDMEVGHSWDS